MLKKTKKIMDGGGNSLFLFFKMPKSAYNVFVSEVRPKLRAANPNLSFGDISKKLGALWKEISIEDKKPYYDKAGLSLDAEISKGRRKVKRSHRSRRWRRSGGSDNDEDDNYNE
jgi:hypothetical protein